MACNWRSQPGIGEKCGQASAATVAGRIAAGERGTTMLELLVSLALSAMLGLTAFAVVQAILGTSRRQELGSSSQQSAGAGLDMMVRDIQLAGYGTDAASIRVAEERAIELRSDWNGDGDSDDANERVRYAVNDARQTLTRASGDGSPQPLLRGLEPGGLRLTYFAAGGVQLLALGADDLERITRIRIDVAVRVGDVRRSWHRHATIRRSRGL